MKLLSQSALCLDQLVLISHYPFQELIFMGCQGYQWQLKRPTDQTDHIAQPQIHPGVDSLSHKSAFSLDSLQIYILLGTQLTNNENLKTQKEVVLWKKYRREITKHQRATEQVHDTAEEPNRESHTNQGSFNHCTAQATTLWKRHFVATLTNEATTQQSKGKLLW